jgi:two-component system sensor histidine kinase BaeS
MELVIGLEANKMKYSLKTKLSISYIFMALFLVAIIILCINILLENQFKSYIMKQQEQRNTDIINLIPKQYNPANDSWDIKTIENIGVNALEQGIIMKVQDKAGKMLWDSTVHNNGLCVQMLTHMSANMHSKYPNFKGGYIETNYPITVNQKEVAIVKIGYFGPYYFTDNDLAFINSFNIILTAVGILSLLFALILGAYMAKRISRPISIAVNATEQISKGNFGERIEVKSRTKEISLLTGSINNLADTLEKQEVLRKRMAADVAHELRTPLANLQSSMEAMIDGIWALDTKRIKSCHEEIMRINRMVGDMEKIAKFEAENITLNKSTFDVSEVIQHILNNFETDFKNKNIQLIFNSGKETIEADKDKISQVVTNLVSNALKYTNQGGTVEISVKGSENTTEIRVKDNGNGIPSEDLPYIFERFYRADKSRNRLTGGTGLGLTIAKSIVLSHKGKIDVISELDKGSEFIILLPRK